MDYDFLLDGINKIEKIQEEQTIAITMLQGYILASKTINDDTKSSSKKKSKSFTFKTGVSRLATGEEVRKYKGKTIKKRADGRYWARYYKDGKQHSVYGQTVEECLQNLKKALSGKTKQQKETFKCMTFGQWLQKWLELYKVGKVKDSTLDQMQRYLNELPTSVVQIPLNRLTSMYLQAYFKAINKPRKKRKNVYLLKRCAY